MGALRFRIAMLRYDAHRFYERYVIWKILRCIPRHIKYWVIIQAATKHERGNPSTVTALTMLDRMSADYDEPSPDTACPSDSGEVCNHEAPVHG